MSVEWKRRAFHGDYSYDLVFKQNKEENTVATIEKDVFGDNAWRAVFYGKSYLNRWLAPKTEDNIEKLKVVVENTLENQYKEEASHCTRVYEDFKSSVKERRTLDLEEEERGDR